MAKLIKIFKDTITMSDISQKGNTDSFLFTNMAEPVESSGRGIKQQDLLDYAKTEGQKDCSDFEASLMEQLGQDISSTEGISEPETTEDMGSPESVLNDIKAIIVAFGNLQSDIQTYHWLTNKYSHHEILGEKYDDLNDKIDDFVECYISIYGKVVECVTLDDKIAFYRNIKKIDISSDPLKILENSINIVMGEGERISGECESSELKAIWDEIKIILRKINYLLVMD
jgi:hypothetical protein